MPEKRYLLHSRKQSRISEVMSNLAIADMSDAELDELSSSIAYARQARTGDKYSFAEIELWQIVQEMFNRPQSLDHFVRGMDGSAGFGVQRFLSCAQTLEATVNKACALGSKQKSMRNAVRRLMLGCLRNWLKSANVPPSPRALLLNIDKLEYAVDQEYPGYIEAGILCFVLAPLPHSE